MAAKGVVVTKPADNADVTLIVVRRSGKKLKGNRILLHTDVVAALRAACVKTVEQLRARTPVAFTADLSYDPVTEYLEVPASVLTVSLPQGKTGSASGGTLETDAEAHAVLEAASSLQLLDSSELKQQTFLFYAAVVGSTAAKRQFFVTKWNPYRSGMAGKILTSFREGLRHITDPILIFEPAFHMVVTSGGIAVLNKDAFDKVFRDIDQMRARVPVWADHVAEALPLTTQSSGYIRDVCMRNSRVAAKARALFESGVLTKKLTVKALQDEMRQQNLDVDRMVQGNKLVIEESDVPTLLKLLDESLWRGWITATAWEAGSKSKRG